MDERKRRQMMERNRQMALKLQRQRQLQMQRRAMGMGEDAAGTTVRDIAPGEMPVRGAPDLYANLSQALPPALRPGNVGDINRVIWPFFFTFSAPELAPNGVTGQGTFSVTQEAAFVWMAMSKVVFVKTTGPTQYTALDPDNYDLDDSDATGLKFTLMDASSSRTFMGSLLDIDQIGVPTQPTILPTPILLLPNATIRADFQNDNTTATYVPWITFFGYRVRIGDIQNVLGTVTG